MLNNFTHLNKHSTGCYKQELNMPVFLIIFVVRKEVSSAAVKLFF